MQILAFETSTDYGSVALMDDSGNVLAEQTVLSRHRHSEHLLPMVDQLLRQCEVDMSEIDYFATSRGPGSFSGIRVGMSTARAFATACRKEVIGVSALEAMSLSESHYGGWVCPILDAGRQSFYVALYRHHRYGKSEKWIPETLVSMMELRDLLRDVEKKSEGTSPVLMVGSASCQKLIAEKYPSVHVSTPRAVHVGLLAVRDRMNANGRRSETLQPLYVQLPQQAHLTHL